MSSVALCINTHKPTNNEIQNCIQNTNNFDERLIYFNNESSQKDVFNFKVFMNIQNLSAADGFNFVIKQSLSEWICPFCIDDFFADNINDLLNQIHNNIYDDYDIIKCSCYCGNDVMKWKIIGDDKIENLSILIKQKNCIPFSSIYKRKVFDELGGYRNIPYCDWDFWYRAIQNQYKIINYITPTYYWSIHPGQLFEREAKEFGHENIKNRILNGE